MKWDENAILQTAREREALLPTACPRPDSPPGVFEVWGRHGVGHVVGGVELLPVWLERV